MLSREYLDKIGLTDREEDDGGPIYGFNFRHFGAKYIDCHTDYTGQTNSHENRPPYYALYYIMKL